MALRVLSRLFLFFILQFIFSEIIVANDNDILVTSIDESISVGNVVLDLKSVLNKEKYWNFNEITFLTIPPFCQSYFSLQNQKILLAKLLNRVDSCMSNSYFDMQLFYRNAKIKDIRFKFTSNKNTPPYFSTKLLQLKLDSNTKVGHELDLPLAKDDDFGENSLLTYSLEPYDDLFTLTELKNSEGTVVGLKLKLLKQIVDNRKYNYLVVATDHGDKTLNARLNVTIETFEENTNNLNTNNLGFTEKLYKGIVKTDDKNGIPIVQVKIINSEKEKLRYYFPHKTKVLYGDIFEINEQKGFIILKNSSLLASKINSENKFLVMAEIASNTVPLSTSVKIDIIISNKYKPQIILNSSYTYDNNTNLAINENNKMDLELASVTVIDDDLDAAGMINCKVDSQLFYLKKLNEKNFKLVLKDSLDYEKSNYYKIEIECNDFGKPPFHNLLKVNLFVIDQDDNPPTFLKNSYSAMIPENSEIGTKIVKLSVVDKDHEARNKKVKFFIEPPFERWFSIEQSSGLVLTADKFDREKISQYSFEVFAQSGNERIDVKDSYLLNQTSKALINVTIIDENDEIAKFEKPWFKFEIAENQPANSYVGTVVAIDADLPPFNHVHYSMVPFSNLNSYKKKHDSKEMKTFQKLPFKLHETSGIITTTSILDREEKNKYDFKVYVGNESTTVYVEIKDVNDNPPIFRVPLPNSCQESSTLQIKGNLTFSRELTQIYASDSDENDELTYSIIAGNDFNQLKIDAPTGKVFWNSHSTTLANNNGCKTLIKFKAQDFSQHLDIACLELIFEVCQLLQVEQHQAEMLKHPDKGFFSLLTDHYFLIIIVVLVCCSATVIILSTAICITRYKTKKLKQKGKLMMMNELDMKSNMQLSRSEADTLLVLNRNHDHESSDQLTGILVSLKSVEQLQRLQLRSLAPSRDSLMSNSTSFCKERDGDSGYADVASPV